MKRLMTAVLAASLVLMGAMATAQVRTVTDPAAPRGLPAEGPVGVQWTDPAQFAELRSSGNRFEARRGNWVAELAEHLRTTAERRLPAGERLEVTFTDIDLAGDYESRHGTGADNIRMMRETHPPMIELTYRRLDAGGAVIDEGDERLRDLNYLRRTLTRDQDRLRYEKRLIDDWLRRTLDN